MNRFFRVTPGISRFRKVIHGVRLPEQWGAFKSLLVHTYRKSSLLLDTNRVAAFDFDGCLCVRNGGNTEVQFPRDLVSPSVPDRLQALHKAGFRVAILTNEVNISRFSKNVNSVRKVVEKKIRRLEAFVRFVGVPVEILVSTAYDDFRKPCTKDRNRGKPGGIGMWMFLANDEADMGFKQRPLPGESLFVGDAAGRPNDFSDGDLCFARESGLRFFNEHEFFAPDAKPLSELVGVPIPESSLRVQASPATQTSSTTTDSSPFMMYDVVSPSQLRSPKTLVVMMGLPGSGKTTVGNMLVESLSPNTVRCERFSQDALGSKARVHQAVSHAFLSGCEIVVVDRTNINESQRATWLSLAKQVGALSVVMEIRTQVHECVARLVNRRDHEGASEFPHGQGNREKIRHIVNNFVLSRQPVSPNEDVDVHVHATGTPRHMLAQLRGVLFSNTKPHHSDKHSGGAPQPTSQSTSPGLGCLETASVASTDPQNRGIGESMGPESPEGGVPVLMFPSVSTDDFRVDADVATDILCSVLRDWLAEHDTRGIQLRLVEPVKSRLTDALVSGLPGRVQDERFTVVRGDLMASAATCSGRAIVATGCTNRFKMGGDRANIMVHKVFGKKGELHAITSAQLMEDELVGVAGRAYPVYLPQPLAQALNVLSIVHVLGPNVNPNRAGVLEPSDPAVERLLRSAYISMLDCYLEMVRVGAGGRRVIAQVKGVVGPKEAESGGKPDVVQMSQEAKTGNNQTVDSTGGTRAVGNGAGAGNSIRNDGDSTPNNHNSPPNNHSSPPNDSTQLPAYAAPKGPPPKVRGGWSQALLNFVAQDRIERTASMQEQVYFETNDTVVIYDGFPKAKFHLLVVPKLNHPAFVNSIKELEHSKHGAGAIQGLHGLARQLANHLGVRTRCGYHAKPSLRPLHIHVMSEDFDSPCFKNKKHYNSFAHSEFFLTLDAVEQELSLHSRVQSAYRDDLEDLLKSPLVCFRCGENMKNIPSLKAHLKDCGVGLSG